MALLKEDGSLDIERINNLPREERMREIGSFTREQFQEYLSKTPINEGYTHTRVIKFDKPMGVNLSDVIRKIRSKQFIETITK